MKYFFAATILVLSGICNYTRAQTQCVKPKPMSGEQKNLVAGTWEGSYTYNGAQRKTVMNIDIDKSNEVACTISNPPVAGKEKSGEYFFCSGGEFHMVKYIGDTSYVFQGVPENGHIKGILSIYTPDAKRTLGGHFVFDRIEGKGTSK